ncbi:MAG: hypothetical protein ACOC0U_03915 [Desulfovibrionales bacterium]
MRRFILLLPFMALLLAGCPGEEEVPTPETTAESVSERLSELENRFLELEQRHERDIDTLQENLKNIMQYLQITLENVSKIEQESENGIGSTAKRSLEENLQKLLDLSKRMIDKLEQELNESLQREPEPSP